MLKIFPLFFPLGIFGPMYFYLKEPKAKSPTLVYLIFRAPGFRTPFKKSTNQKVHPKDWDGKSRMPIRRKGRSDLTGTYKVLQRYSDFLDSLVDSCKINDIHLTKELLIERYDEVYGGNTNIVQKLDVVECVQAFIDAKNRSKGQSKSWNQKYTNLKLKLQYFRSHRGPYHFKDINEDWLDEYCGYLREIKEEPFSPHNDNTLHRNINFLFTFLNWSRGKYHDIDMDKLRNPVKKYQPEDVYLTASEVRDLEGLELKRESWARVRDLFLVGIYSGQRFSDYSVFEKADVVGNMIIKKAEKTENESFIPLHDKLLKILEKYDWELPRISEQKFNEHIKDICEEAGMTEEVKETIYRGNQKETRYNKKFEMVGSHTARRTFITLASEQGMPDHIIMKITGIRDPKTLLKYKKTSQRAVEESMKRLWE